MTASIRNRARKIFLECLEHGVSEHRDNFIEMAAEGHSEILAEVKRLLYAHEANGSFLERPVAVEIPVAHDDDRELPATSASDLRDSGKSSSVTHLTTTESPPESIGPYRIRERLAEGGMGVVYIAEQARPVRRRVAIKLIKPGMDSGQVIARFEAERQALAMMDHPNIAKVFDAGTIANGRPYFVMELIRGIPITDYCDRSKMSIARRLDLFRDACSAIQHAHNKGIIHRDIKPSNVLVTENDGTPLVKVIDFGIAKALTDNLTDRTLYTAVFQVMGTPLYMSPEQASFSHFDVDTRSDVYSLGVML